MIRKIKTREEIEKKERRNKMIIGIILGVIMLFSSAGYAFFSFGNEDSSSINKKVVVNNIEFKQTDYGYWSFSYGGNSYETRFNPLDTENISLILTKTISSYYGKPLYFGINGLFDVASNGKDEILRNMQKIIIKSQFSCLDKNCTENYPIKNCSVDNVIIFKSIDSNISYVNEDKNCITINYALGDEEKASDAFLFRLMGIK
jgi:hypothetical protein